MTIVVGGIIYSNGKYLLVQEKKEICYGKWNLPAGRLELNENILDGAKREIKEETGLDVELTNLVQIANRVNGNNDMISFIFSTKLLSEEIKLNSEELLDIRWFDYNEILSMETELRSPNLILGTINRFKNNELVSIDVIKNI